MGTPHHQVVQQRDERLRRWGLRGWYLVGIAAAGAIVFAGLSAISGLVIPMIVAIVVAMLFVPATDLLERFMPRALAAALVLLALLVAAVGAVVVAVEGVVDQAPEIGKRLAAGIEAVGDWLDEEGWTRNDANLVVDDLGDLWSNVIPGATSTLSTVFSSAAAFVTGTFVGVFMLYFGLKDWRALSGWVARHLGVPADVGQDLVDDSTWSIRQYFMALTVSSVIVAIIVGVSAAIIGMPLAFTIAVVTFATSYVPYLGAIFSGAFAVLIALGSSGVNDAVVILAVVLIAQNLVQTVVQTLLTEGRLKLHPIVIFGSTVAGGAVFGLLGAALSTPLVAIVLRATKRLGAGSPSASRADGET